MKVSRGRSNENDLLRRPEPVRLYPALIARPLGSGDIRDPVRIGMDRQNQFLEPERGGSSMIGWAVKQLAIWLVGGFVVYTVVVNHRLFSDGASDSAPHSAIANTNSAYPAERQRPQPSGQAGSLVTNTLALRARADGHVFVTATVNGVEIPFIVDTGATLVSLTHADALKIGVAGSLNYTIPINVANGVTKGAPVMLREIRIGQLEVGDVEGMVIQGEGGISLLGQSFLKRLQGYEMRGDLLTLSWQQ
jgi:aspartyl protease family protein